MAIQGLPLEGGDKGCFYVSSGADKKTILKAWKNKEKGDRWWYKEVAKLSSPCYGLQVTKDDKLYVFSRTEVFRFENDKLEKILDVGKFGLKPGGPPGVTAFGIDGDGETIYFGDNGEPGKIWRIPSDQSKAEEYAGGFGWKRGSNRAPDGRLYICGPAKNIYMMCGPWMGQSGGKFLPPDCLFPGSADERDARRIRDGRASTLCKDGEWRELDRGEKNQALYKFRAWTPGPNGTAYSYYDGAKEIRVYRITGIDYNKPTVGPQFQGK
jgi:hypothetical protein